MQDLSKRPYHDDYNEDNGFHRVLFRPSFAVQARELNQLQTILQDQVKRFGNHMFKNGAMIKPGGITFDNDVPYVKLDATYAGSAINVYPWLGKEIVGSVSGTRAVVVNTTPASGSDIDADPPTFYIKYTASGSRTKKAKRPDGTEYTYVECYDSFIDGEDIKQVDNDHNLVRVKKTAAIDAGTGLPLTDDAEETFTSCGRSSHVTIDEGIYFINGFFVKVQKQSVIVDKYSATPTVKAGLRLYDTIVTPEQDASLQDNALGSYNYAAPGAHRYKLTLKLEWVPYTPDAFTDTDTSVTNDGDHFIMLLAVVDGEVTYQCESTEYGEMERTLARRTYDESGNYTVTPFMLTTYEHLKDPDNPKYALGRFLANDEKHPGDKNKIAIQMSSGKAYVKGFERLKKAPTWLEIDKARDTKYVNNAGMSYVIGNFVYVTRVYQLPDVPNMQEVTLYDRDITMDGDLGSALKVGTARVRGIDLDNKGGKSPTEFIYRLYLFDVKMNPGKAFSDVGSISAADAANSKAFTCSTVIDTAAFPGYDGSTQRIVMPGSKSNLIKLPHQYIATSQVGGMTDVNPGDTCFEIQCLTDISTNGQTTFTIPSNDGTQILSDPDRWLICDTSATSAAAAYMQIEEDGITCDATGATVRLKSKPNGKLRVLYPVNKGNTSPRKKVRQWFNNNSDEKHRGEWIKVPASGFTNTIELGKADGDMLLSVWMAKDANVLLTLPSGPEIGNIDKCVDITERFEFDGGQRDTYYGSAVLKVKSGFNPPEFDIIVEYVYFQHNSGGDYFCVDSYYEKKPGKDAITKTDYEFVPFYKMETGETVRLADCIDFRPIINNKSLSGVAVFPNSTVRVDYEYYLSRIDKIYLDMTGKFGVARGIPADTPEPPTVPSDAMLLWTLTLAPYTTALTSITKAYEDNKRFTMRDIGKLETRIEKLEYYVSLTMLELQTMQMQITDSEGNNRFKNGFIVDPFKDHSIGSLGHADYKCSIDASKQELRATFASNFTSMEFDSDASEHFQRTSSLITLPYESVPFIEQPAASDPVNINPFAVRKFGGEITFQPDSDQWYEKTKTGNKVVDYSPNYDALSKMSNALASTIEGTHYGQWMTGVDVQASGVTNKKTTTSSTSTSTTSTSTSRTGGKSHWGTEAVNNDPAVYLDKWHRKKGIGAMKRETSTTITTTTTSDTTFNAAEIKTVPASGNSNLQTRIGETITKSTQVTQTDFGDRTVGISDIQYMRSLNVLLKASNMKPNTRVYPFFDDVDVKEYCVPCPQVSVVEGSMHIDGEATLGAFFHTDDTVEEYLIPYDYKSKIGTETDIEKILALPGCGKIDYAQVLHASYNNTPKRDYNGNKILGPDGKPLMSFNYASITFYNWRGSADASVVGKFSKDSKLYGVKSHCVCTLAEDPVVTKAGDDIRTDKSGRTALMFLLPNNDKCKFKTGERLFVLNDNLQNAQSMQTRAEGKFVSRGYDLKTEGTIVSTKTIQYSSTPAVQQKTTSVSSTTKTTSVSYVDPLAQSFVVDVEGGIFVTAIKVCFATKDDSLPAKCSIIEMSNGMPTQNEVPYSASTLYPDQITTCEDLRKDPFVWTTFKMQAPVFLQHQQEYAIFLKSDSFDYTVWCATLGQKDLRTGKSIDSQPYDGVIFKSQNSSTWTEDQEQDMCFCIERAQFDINGVGRVMFDNAPRGPMPAEDYNAAETFINSKLVRFHAKDHGLCEGSQVNVTGFKDDVEYNGILGKHLNGNHKVVRRSEIDSFLVELTNAGGIDIKATRNGRIAEVNPVFDTNLPFQVMHPNIANIVLPDTKLEWAYRYTTAQSVAGDEIAYQTVGNWIEMNMQEDNYLASAGLIASNSNLGDKVGEGTDKFSLRFQGRMTSDKPNLSPVIDLNRTGCILVNNRIDAPDLTQAYPKLQFEKDSDIVTVTIPEGHIMTDGAMVYLDCSDTDGELEEASTIDPLTGKILQTVTKANTNPSLFPVKDPKKVIAAGKKDANTVYARDLEAWYTVKRLNDTQFTITMPQPATANAIFNLSDVNDPDSKFFNVSMVSLWYSKTNYRYVPENKPINACCSSRYFTGRVHMDKKSTSVRIMFTCSATSNTDFEIWCKTSNEYVETDFDALEWFKVNDPSFARRVSETRDDYKDYECTLELTDGSGTDDKHEFTDIAVKIVMKSKNQCEVPLFKNLRVICLAT